MIEIDLITVGTKATLIASVPAGPSTVIIGNNSGTAVSVGGSAVTTSTGFVIPSGSAPVSIPGYTASAATQLYAVAGGTAVTVGVIVSTDG